MRTPLLVVAFVFATASCRETPPDRLTLEPSGPFHFEKKDEHEEVKVAAFTGQQPYVKKVPAEWKSSDTSVATVDDKGQITATGSGKSTITVTAWGLTASADVNARIVGSVTVADDVPKPLRLNGKGWQLKVTVKDDKGAVIEKPERVMYRATDYCVEASDEGFLKPLTEGDCDVVINVAGASTKVKVSVKE